MLSSCDEKMDESEAVIEKDFVLGTVICLGTILPRRNPKERRRRTASIA